jgi:guanylate kinase
LERLAAGEFIGHEYYYGNWYGIDRAKLQVSLTNGHTVIVMGGNAGITLRDEFPETIFVYLTAPIDQLRARLLSRGEPVDQVEVRLHYEAESWEKPQLFDIVVCNGDGELKNCVKRIVAIVNGEC